jgi:secreted Zn-dependent insulinase-like peptidase
MLFLGSKKYNDTEAFSQQLALFGGEHNAYTSAEDTVYFNEIDNDGVEKGLDIFAQFFISPSFNSEMVDKEIHAVDSEHKKNMPETQRRLWHLLRSRANPESPVHLFSTGNLHTLKLKPESEGKSLVEALKTFHRQNYCPSRLHLVLVSKNSTTELLDLAHRHFDDLPEDDTCAPRPTYTDRPLYSQALGNLGRRFTVGSAGSPEMWVVLPMPPLKREYKKLAEAYVWNALGHYGAGSLKSKLKREDLSHSYSFYAENTVAGSVLFVTFRLTQKGAQSTDTILEYFFAYLNAVRKAGVNPQLLANIRQMRQVEFDYQEKKPSEFDFVSSLAGSLPSYAPEDALTGGVLIDEPDEDLIRKVLAAMVPGNMNIALVSPAFNESQAAHREPYYDFGYDEEALDPALLSRLEGSTGLGLAPPPDLQYVPKALQLTEEGAEGAPERLLQKGRVELWWLGMGEVKLPKAIVSLKLGFPPSAISRVEDAVLAALHVRLVNAALEEPSDALQTCGLSYAIDTHRDGLGITFSGFDEHLQELMAMVLPKVREPGSLQADFQMARRQLLLDVSDVTRQQPYSHAMEAFEVVTIQNRFSREELRMASANEELVNPGAHRKFLAEVLSKAQVSLLFTGNIDKARTLQMTELIERGLGITRDQSEVEHEGHPLVVDPREELEVRVPNPIAGDPNSATLAVYQFGVPTIADRVHLSMLGDIINRPIFEVLRTRHQLGYVVFGYVTQHASILEVRVLVQGFREPPDTVDMLIEGAVQNLTAHIANISAEEFATRKSTLRTSLTHKASTLSQVAGRYWSHIWDKTYCFQKVDLQLKYLDGKEFNSPAPLLEAWKKAVAPAEGQRKRIVVKLFGSKDGHPVAPLQNHTSGPVNAKVITLVDSVSVGKQLKDEQYWPHDYICK